MNKLQLLKLEHFGEVEADIYSNGDEMFMTINQLTECLEYADKRAIEKLLERNPYLKNEEFSYLQRYRTQRGVPKTQELSPKMAFTK